MDDRAAPEMSPQEFENSRSMIRRAVIGSALLDIGAAIVVLAVGAPAVVALILVAFALFGTPLALSGLDRNWRKQGYDI